MDRILGMRTLTCIRHRSLRLAVFRRYLLKGGGFCFGIEPFDETFLRDGKWVSILFGKDFIRKLYFFGVSVLLTIIIDLFFVLRTALVSCDVQ